MIFKNLHLISDKQSFRFSICSLGSDPQKLFPYEALLDQFHKFGRFGLIMASLLLPMITSDEDATPNLDELAENMKKNVVINDNGNLFSTDKNEDAFNERLRDIIVDMVQLNYF